ncbi:hypothetical protein THAOC_08000 [Thalassiosira oceanica]|uniref:Uncharacterized protein n=1 Tax=Thalassiosira oceanica TaxID=159749 RepID=K0TB10_THAOC|nr:hypothetical protein THAOC_08000 [Thalassiosira oceanica]|eukprot:EJK70626.1 hypothetical protein THAOC_08000 [Thalassiosira oceanica]
MARTVGPLPPRSGTAWTPRRRDDDDASDDKGARARLPPKRVARHAASHSCVWSTVLSRGRTVEVPGGAPHRLDELDLLRGGRGHELAGRRMTRMGHRLCGGGPTPLRPHFADPGRQVEWKGALFLLVDPYALGPAGLVLGDDVPCSNPRLWRGSTHLRTKAVAVRVAREEGIFAATATRRARGLNLLLIYEKHSSPCPFPFTVWNGLRMATQFLCTNLFICLLAPP